jgi:predicted XRE-type DNA-binding protein
MNTKTKAKLEAAGFAVGDVDEFLTLTPEELALVELRAALSRTVRTKRLEAALTQAQLAERMKSTQARVAKIEDGSQEVSLDLMFRGLFAVGGRVADVVPTQTRRAKRTSASTPTKAR